jgi:DNA gyrase/topoisomerase IV subunit A
MADQHPAPQPGRGDRRLPAAPQEPETTIDELIRIIPAPDFPTAGIIYGVADLQEGYRTGRGRVIMRARTHVEDIGKGERQAIIIDELPYQVNKAQLLIKIGEMVREKRSRASRTCATRATSRACAR